MPGALIFPGHQWYFTYRGKPSNSLADTARIAPVRRAGAIPGADRPVGAVPLLNPEARPNGLLRASGARRRAEFQFRLLWLTQ